jgi:hypothetical protein
MQRKRQKILLLRVFSFLFREPTQVRKGSKEKNIVTTDRRPMCCSGQCWWWALLSSSSSSSTLVSQIFSHFCCQCHFPRYHLDLWMTESWWIFSGIYYNFLPNLTVFLWILIWCYLGQWCKKYVLWSLYSQKNSFYIK